MSTLRTHFTFRVAMLQPRPPKQRTPRPPKPPPRHPAAERARRRRASEAVPPRAFQPRPPLPIFPHIMLARPRTLPTGFIAPCLPTKTDKLPSGSQWLHGPLLLPTATVE